MVKQAYRKEKKSTAESDLSHMDRLLFQQAPLAFVAYENPEAEAMLLDMISRAEIRGNIETAIEKAAQKPTVEGLRAMRRRLADMMQKYPADVSRGASSYVSLVRAIETAERLLPGQADVRSTSPQPDAQLNSATVSGSERRGGKNPGSFWKEPFAWLSGALALAAVLVVLLRCTKGHRARA